MMTYSRPWMCAGLTLMVAGAILLWRQSQQPAAQAAPPKTSAVDPHRWKDLFDGNTLGGWKASDFGAKAKVYVRQGAIVMDGSEMMAGVTWTGDLPRTNYELEFEGMRLAGSDFFCTTTFPVGREYCSLVVGGWGGRLVGLSSIDGADASENDTTTAVDFKDCRWYKIRIRVTDAAVAAWIDGKHVVDQSRKDCKFSIRMEVEPSRPLGIATWYTEGAVRNIRLRGLKPEEK
jgi:hypothetical protein